MAVRHGYGKIAGTDALVFAYDTGDTRNSYKGEPTENLFSTTAMYFQDDAGVYTNDIESGTDDIGNYFIKDVNNAPWWSGLRIYQNGVTPLTAGVSYVLSFECRSGQTGWSWSYDANASGGGWSGNDAGRASNTNLVFDKTGGTSYTSDMVNTWQRVTYRVTMKDSSTFTGASAYPHDSFFTNTNNVKIYYRNPQLEVGKSHATQFVYGTRSATEGLKDLTGNKSINLTNTSFDTNAQKDFDGSSDFLTINVVDEIYDSDYSVETIFKRDVSGVAHGIITDYQYGWWRLKVTSANTLYFNHKLNDSNINQLYSTSTVGTAWTHVIVTFSKTDGVKMYINGELDNSNSDTRIFGLTSGRGPQYIGYSRNGAPSSPSEYFNGKIPVVKICLKTLTADEVRNNYRHYKKRFNI